MGFLQDDCKGRAFQSDLWVGWPRHTLRDGLTFSHMVKTLSGIVTFFFMSCWALSEFRESEMRV